MIDFQENDVSLESQWRALILFGKNSATYKFAFAKSLLELIEKEKTVVTLADLAQPFARNITMHLNNSDKQGSSNSSQFLNYCRQFNEGKISEVVLYAQTEKLGFVNVVDAFQNINGGTIPRPFYEKDYGRGKKQIVITDHLLSLKDSMHFENFAPETEARWNLVETAWNLKVNPNLLEVQHDEATSMFFINDVMRRIDITSVRDSLNGYQKGKCFYSYYDISVISGSPNICHVDHFLPHLNKRAHAEAGGNINGVWNLVLAHSSMNGTGEKGSKVPDFKYLQRLHNRNEFYIQSKHPLAETIINQTGTTEFKRKSFLQRHYDIAKEHSVVTWRPTEELPGTF